MKLRRSEIDHIAKQISDRLLCGDYIKVKDTEAATVKIANTIVEDLAVEDKLNEEVRQILEKHADEVQRGGVEYHRMFNMVKAKLIRERNLIL